MNKWYGNIGFAELVESEPGLWEETITVRPYYGDVLRNYRRLSNSGNVNDNVTVSNQISIVSDPYADQNFHSIRYVEYMGSKWKVSDVEVQRPRLILSLGEVYNGYETGTPDQT